MPHDPEVKAAAMAALLAGQGTSEVAREYDIPTSTVHDWRERAAEYLSRPEIGELLLDYLHELLPTLREQVRVFRSREWLEKQNASEAAVLHGVLVDKAVRLLQALEPEAGEQDLEPVPEPIRGRSPSLRNGGGRTR